MVLININQFISYVYLIFLVNIYHIWHSRPTKSKLFKLLNIVAGSSKEPSTPIARPSIRPTTGKGKRLFALVVKIFISNMNLPHSLRQLNCEVYNQYKTNLKYSLQCTMMLLVLILKQLLHSKLEIVIVYKCKTKSIKEITFSFKIRRHLLILIHDINICISVYERIIYIIRELFNCIFSCLVPDQSHWRRIADYSGAFFFL